MKNQKIEADTLNTITVMNKYKIHRIEEYRSIMYNLFVNLTIRGEVGGIISSEKLFKVMVNNFLISSQADRE
jgi:hypothetical protein